MIPLRDPYEQHQREHKKICALCDPTFYNRHQDEPTDDRSLHHWTTKMLYAKEFGYIDTTTVSYT